MAFAASRLLLAFKGSSVKKSDVVQRIFHQKIPSAIRHEKGLAFAPTNIALCKYWGKRNSELNLPMTSSLSVALPDKGALTGITFADRDIVYLNDVELSPDTQFVQKIVQFLDLFRQASDWRLEIRIRMNVPVAAGLASSACGFAALVLALNDLFKWELNQRDLSILARLGSGSASRSLWKGFVEWHAGAQLDGMDCYSEPLPFEWPNLMLAILCLSDQPKPISSREAMQRTVDTSLLYSSWPRKVLQDIIIIKQALYTRNFPLLAGTAESNALNMHATMISSWPPICYFLPETIAAMHKIWNLRKQGLNLFFTQDAGPNLKLLFLEENRSDIENEFENLEMLRLFEA